VEQASNPIRPWFTWANALTLMRALLALPTAICIFHSSWLAAALCFALAVATDAVDGPLARRLGQASALGGLLDHATDALFVTLVLATAALAGSVTWLLPTLIPVAFVQYVADSSALRGRPLRGNRLGRLNGISYFVLAGTVIVVPLAASVWPGLAGVGAALTWWVSVALVLTTACSMIERARRAQTG
jgi:phosphatidylglycerophosphate synthase